MYGKTILKHLGYLVSLSSVLMCAPLAALPITYDIGAGSAPGFSGSWLHAGSREMGNSGYFTNGDKIRINGQLTLDLDAGQASGVLTGRGHFGLGDSFWTLTITGASSNTHTFIGGETDLVSLDYRLIPEQGIRSTGTFHFASRDFNGGAADDGPNYIDNNKLLLWGNNWVNSYGAIDRYRFVNSYGHDDDEYEYGHGYHDNDYSNRNYALGLDLYGTAVSAPEPGIALLLLTGLLGITAVARVRHTA